MKLLKIKPTIAATCFIAMACAVTAAQDRGRDRDRGDRDSSDGRMERFYGYLDQNKDGNIDAEEMRKMPSSFRDSLRDSGIDLDRGMSKEQFMREVPRAYEEMKERKEREERDKKRGDDRNRDDDRRREEPNRTESTKKAYSYVPQKRKPVTMNIPSKFNDGDTDGDGQIGLYEWRIWRPTERLHFPLYDHNKDGFLTPKELSQPPSKEELSVATTGDSSSKTVAKSTSSTAPSEQKIATTAKVEAKPANAPEESKLAKTARLFFKQMDSDKNNQITSEEWARSRRLKPKFEAAGVDLTQPMDESQFVIAYEKVYGS